MQFRASVDVRSLERVRLLAVELEALEREMGEKIGQTNSLTVRLHAIRARFLADLDGDKLERA